MFHLRENMLLLLISKLQWFISDLFSMAAEISEIPLCMLTQISSMEGALTTLELKPGTRGIWKQHKIRKEGCGRYTSFPLPLTQKRYLLQLLFFRHKNTYGPIQIAIHQLSLPAVTSIKQGEQRNNWLNANEKAE